ncbi:MAG: hypothetical protein AB1558_15935 [Thermodesulfobacteriota bacterium]
MKRLMWLMTIAAMLLTAPVSAQTQASPAAKDVAPAAAVKAAPADEAGKKETKKTKMTKKTKKADALEGQFKPSVR